MNFLLARISIVVLTKSGLFLSKIAPIFNDDKTEFDKKADLRPILNQYLYAFPSPVRLPMGYFEGTRIAGSNRHYAYSKIITTDRLVRVRLHAADGISPCSEVDHLVQVHA